MFLGMLKIITTTLILGEFNLKDKCHLWKETAVSLHVFVNFHLFRYG